MGAEPSTTITTESLCEEKRTFEVAIELGIREE